jgi:four helix bundle protein
MEDSTQSKSSSLTERLLLFAAHCIALTSRLGKSMAGRYVVGQLMRASASSGANYQEACAAESRADFIHKLQIVLKELREADYWLRLIDVSRLMATSELTPVIKEVDELTRIVAKSVLTAKSRNK